MHSFHPSILREYDIRGVVGETLRAEDAYAIGRAFASVRPEWKAARPRIAVGRDGRLSSPEMEVALVRGLMESGTDVVRIGVGPTPMLYFAVCALSLEGGVMVTGSHNPPDHNGFKFMLGRKAFHGADIRRLAEAAAKGEYHLGTGRIREESVREEYMAELARAYRGDRALKAAWDAGNGAAGEVVSALCEKLPGEHVPLFTEIDGRFPNHHPNPSVPENLRDLIATVAKQKCDVGFAFDGDGDRLGVVDETGEILWGDQILALLAREVLAEHPGATIIADVKASQTLFDGIAAAGGAPLMWKTGHSLIKDKMAEIGALLAGEMSGHIFFADRYYGFDDGLYAAVRLLSLVSRSGKTLSELRRSLPRTFASPERRIACADARKFDVIRRIRARLTKEGARMNDIDGVRVTTEDGWFLLRASNTEAALVARCEGNSAEALRRLEETLRDILAHETIAYGSHAP